MKFSGYYFYMNLNIQRNFQICISVPLLVFISCNLPAELISRPKIYIYLKNHFDYHIGFVDTRHHFELIYLYLSYDGCLLGILQQHKHLWTKLLYNLIKKAVLRFQKYKWNFRRDCVVINKNSLTITSLRWLICRSLTTIN